MINVESASAVPLLHSLRSYCLKATPLTIIKHNSYRLMFSAIQFSEHLVTVAANAEVKKFGRKIAQPILN